MKQRHASIAKISRPTTTYAYRRTRLFRSLDRSRGVPVTWISGPAGSGKTTLIASWLDARELPCIWFQVDEGDADLATFFYYLGLAAKEAAPGIRQPLPLLTPEYAFGIPTFTRRYFENLYARLLSAASGFGKAGRNGGFVIVFDNYQTIPPDAAFHEIMQTAMSGMPEGIRTIILSRTDPPPAFAGMFAGNRATLMGWDDLRLTPEESKAVVRLSKGSRLAGGTIDQIIDKTQGWAAGLVLMTRGVRSAGNVSPLFDGFGPRDIFDYFTNELFDRTSERIRDFLIKTAFLPQMTVPMAQTITGCRDTGRILSDLSHSNYFTEKRQRTETSFQYHPLFREFLLSRAYAALSPAEISRVRLSAAQLLEASGRIEAAAELYREAGEWSRFVQLVLAHAPAFAMQGRSKMLEQWLRAVPEEITGQTPWLRHWMGICRLAVDPVEARGWFAKAFASFKEQKDLSGQLASWSEVIDTFIFGWDTFAGLDPWIAEMEKVMKRHRAFPPGAAKTRVAINMFTALFLRRPSSPALPRWEKRVFALMNACDDLSVLLLIVQRLLLYYILIGDTGRADIVYHRFQGASGRLSTGTPSSMVAQAIAAYYFSFKGSIPECRKAVDAGLRAANDTGVYILNFMFSSFGAYSCLAAGDLRSAKDHLDAMAALSHEGRRGDVCHNHYLLSWEAMLRGDFALAREHGILHRDIALRMGGPFFIGLNLVACALALSACRDHAGAQTHLRAARRIGRETKSALITYKCLLAGAQLALARGREKECLGQTAKAFALGRKKRFFTMDWLLPDVMAGLCARALEHGIETDYAKELIRRHKLMPPEEIAEPGPRSGVLRPQWENWPWPVKIHTLGRFELQRDGVPMSFSGKVQKKPLEMLKALTAFGGRNVSEERIIDALWPDADGDLGHKSFETTLQRLRRLIGDDRTLRLRDNRLSLDERLCWLDTWAFERVSDGMEPGVRNPGLNRRAIHNAVSLYDGHFLPADTRLSWSAFARERLRAKFFRLIVNAGEALENAGQWEKAAALYELGIEKDAVCEEFHQHLMICCRKLGQEARASQVYTRCRKILEQELGLRPSSRTEEILRSIASRR